MSLSSASPCASPAQTVTSFHTVQPRACVRVVFNYYAPPQDTPADTSQGKHSSKPFPTPNATTASVDFSRKKRKHWLWDAVCFASRWWFVRKTQFGVLHHTHTRNDIKIDLIHRRETEKDRKIRSHKKEGVSFTACVYLRDFSFASLGGSACG